MATRSSVAATPLARGPRLPLRRAGAGRVVVRAASEVKVQAKAEDKADIYIGYAKGERRGVGKGRMVKDDPAKYPERNEYCGGWAGGEVGLWGLRDDIKTNGPQVSAEEGLNIGDAVKGVVDAVVPKEQPVEAETFSATVGKGVEITGEVRKADSDVIYVGNSNFIMDDAKQYPDRSELTGGFAGGEQGLKQFLADGEVKYASSSSQGFPVLLVVLGGMVALTAGLTIILTQ